MMAGTGHQAAPPLASLTLLIACRIISLPVFSINVCWVDFVLQNWSTDLQKRA